jgi:hypothetical protein
MAGEAQSVARLYENLETITRFDPTAATLINHAEALTTIAQGWAVPSRILRGR